MAKTWVLDTETKGTGAHLVPLEKALHKPGPEPELALVQLERPERAQAKGELDLTGPRQFKVVDLMTRETLVEGAETAETLRQLGRVRSIVDVNLYVWQPKAGRWRLLTLDEQRALWDMRDRLAAAGCSADEMQAAESDADPSPAVGAASER